MPFVRFSRDKRGYEHVTLVHVATRRGRPSRPRILYWFRTPPGVKVGREPFDEPVRRALEAQNPDVIFDWKQIAQAKMPPVEIEPWRERRRAEREAKQARREQELSQSAPADQPKPAPAAESPALELPAPAALVTAAPTDPASPGVPSANSPRRRRRRRGGRRRGGVASGGMPESSQPRASGPDLAETPSSGERDDEP